jgi:hypothetical protein
MGFNNSEAITTGGNAYRTCFFCNAKLAKWQPDDDNVCNSCADNILANLDNYIKEHKSNN